MSMIDLTKFPEYLRKVIGKTSISILELEQYLENYNRIHDSFGIAANDFAEQLNALQNSCEQITATSASGNLSCWAYFTLSIPGIVEIKQAFCSDLGETLPATEIARLLVRAWASNCAVLNEAMQPTNTIIKSVTPMGFDSDSKRIIADSVAIADYWSSSFQSAYTSANKPLWYKQTNFIISSNSVLIERHHHDKYYFILLNQCINELKIKWRFLSLYRILEHGYLHTVYNALCSEFFSTPEETLDKALKHVKSEYVSFCNLVDKNGLRDEFELIYHGIDDLEKNTNRYATAIKRSCQASQNTEKWRMGVLYVYKMRCSIVHSGVGAPVYDYFVDADVCGAVVLEYLEQLVFSFLRIKLS